MSAKQKNRHEATKRALRIKGGLTDTMATRDSMRAARRGYGLGIGK